MSMPIDESVKSTEPVDTVQATTAVTAGATAKRRLSVWLIIILVVGAAIMGIVAYLYFSGRLSSQHTISDNKDVSLNNYSYSSAAASLSTDSVTASPSASPSSEQVYRNDACGFQISIPSTFTKKQRANTSGGCAEDSDWLYKTAEGIDPLGDKARYYSATDGVSLTLEVRNNDADDLLSFMQNESVSDAVATRSRDDGGGTNLWWRSTLTSVTTAAARGYFIWGGNDDMWIEHPIYAFSLPGKQVLLIHDNNSPDQVRVAKILNSLKIDASVVTGNALQTSTFKVMEAKVTVTPEAASCFAGVIISGQVQVDGPGILIYSSDIGNGGISPTRSAILPAAGTYNLNSAVAYRGKRTTALTGRTWLELYAPTRTTTDPVPFTLPAPDPSCLTSSGN